MIVPLRITSRLCSEGARSGTASSSCASISALTPCASGSLTGQSQFGSGVVCEVEIWAVTVGGGVGVNGDRVGTVVDVAVAGAVAVPIAASETGASVALFGKLQPASRTASTIRVKIFVYCIVTYCSSLSIAACSAA